MSVFSQCMGRRQLEEIDRSGQGLRLFPEDLRRHRKRLTTLVLDGNSLKEIPQVCFSARYLIHSERLFWVPGRCVLSSFAVEFLIALPMADSVT